MRASSQSSWASVPLLAAICLCTGCITSLRSSTPDFNLAPTQLSEIALFPENLIVRNALPAAQYNDYQKDLYEVFLGEPSGKFVNNPNAPYELEVALSCSPPTVNDLDSLVLARGARAGLPVRQNSYFEYYARYRVLDNRGVQVLSGEVHHNVEGHLIGWFWGMSADGSYALWNRASSLLRKQGRFVARDAAHRIVNDIYAHSRQLTDSPLALYASIPPAPTPPAQKPNPPRRTTPVDDKDSNDNLYNRRKQALIIGIDRYEQFTPLRNAVADAQAIADVMSDKYDYDTTLLLNEAATRDGIFSALRLLISKIQEGDNVFVYFAGHGVIDDVFNEGYWIPVDAKRQSQFISNSELHKVIEAMEKAQHVLLIADSCFAGKFLTREARAIGVSNPGASNFLQNTPSPSYYEKLDRRKSRMVITSGGNEPVADGGRDGHSVFAYYLLRALQYPDSPVFSGSELALRLQKAVSNNAPQTPFIGYLKSAGHEEGDIVFAPSRR